MEPIDLPLEQQPSGLAWQEILIGGGALAVDRRATVHYTGWLENGTQFDSSHDRARPFSFPVGAGRVIKGWDERVATMRVGGRRRLIVPSRLGYGDRAVGPIPAGSTLIFDVELIAVE